MMPCPSFRRSRGLRSRQSVVRASSSSPRSCALPLGAAALAIASASASTAPAAGESSPRGFFGPTGVLHAETQTREFNGEPHLVVDLALGFTDPQLILFSVYEVTLELGGVEGFVQNNFPPPHPLWEWIPFYSLPFGDPDATDSFILIGGPFGSITNTTYIDPSFSLPTPHSISGGWYNANPPNLQGTAGPDLQTPIARLVVRLTGQDVTLDCSGIAVWGQQLSIFGSETFSGSFLLYDAKACPNPNGADLDADGAVGSADLGALLAAWGADGGPADLDCSGLVDGGDLGALLSAWTP